MRSRHRLHWACPIIVSIGLLAIAACQSTEPEPDPTEAVAKPSVAQVAPVPAAEPLRNEIPAAELSAVMAAHFKGLGLMEQYEYGAAAEAFRDVHRRAPGWIPGSINLALALLNDTGAKVEEAKKAGGQVPVGNFDEALALLASVLERDPKNPHAHFCSGLILAQQGNFDEAHRHFKEVTETDPGDAAAWYRLASTMTDPENPGRPAGPRQAKEQSELYTKAVELDPYLTPAIYNLAMTSRFTNNPARTKRLFDQFKVMNPERAEATPGPGEFVKAYGEMGKYATVVGPLPSAAAESATKHVPPKFAGAEPLKIVLAEGEKWVTPGDFKGPLALVGRIRERFGAGAAAFDANGDGQLDLYLASAIVGPKGVHDVLLLNKGNGQFEDASATFGLPTDAASIGVAAADFDADRHIDVVLTGAGRNRLLHNRDGKSFEDRSSILGSNSPPAVSLMARWLDLDQDGDLDLYIVNYCTLDQAEKAFSDTNEVPPGLANVAYRNDGEPDPNSHATPQGRTPVANVLGTALVAKGLTLALVPWPQTSSLGDGAKPHTGVAVLDIDNDRDLDLVLTADGSAPTALLNDRLGQFRSVATQASPSVDRASGLLASDFDSDGKSDLVAVSATGRAGAWRNATKSTSDAATAPTFESWPINVQRWRSAQAIDLDLDGATDLLGLPAQPTTPGEVLLPAWAKNDGKRFSTESLPLDLPSPGAIGLIAADFAGDPLPDVLILRSGEAPSLAKNLGNGNRWLALRLGGYWHTLPELMRTNPHAIGTRIMIEGQGLHVGLDYTTLETGLGQSITPVVLGLGNHEQATLVHFRWPDGVMQCELNLASNQKIDVGENNRKKGSCPVLFTWNGERFVCLGDFLGGGGLGYLVAPGVYSQPDRDEAMAITAEQLKASGGVFRLSVTEPMDEVAYLDQLRLEVVDCPPGVAATPDERFAPEGPRATGDLIAWRNSIEPARASDLEGHDMTETLRHWDRRTVDNFPKREGWIGYALEHGIILDFEDRLSRFGQSEKLVLCLAGWVEYPYSQTNYAAATAGVTLKPPAIERLRSDGSWELIEPHAGYPAGLPRLMTLDLTGKLIGPHCKLRIKTTMECYYDQAFIVVGDSTARAAVRVTSAPLARAALAHRGYTREFSPDGRQPLLYDYDYVDPAPLAVFRGTLTRHGDVLPLLQADDDQLCVVGPGDEVLLEFSSSGLPTLNPGWTRSFVVRGIGYCKDADPFTAASDSIGPLPWRMMPPFPFEQPVKRPSDPAYDFYLRAFQTRPAGAGE